MTKSGAHFIQRNGIFSVNCLYKWLHNDIPNKNNTHIWKAKIPLKVKIFFWLLEEKAVLTRDNMKRRNWKGGVC
jgi:hypothetical protein